MGYSPRQTGSTASSTADRRDRRRLRSYGTRYDEGARAAAAASRGNAAIGLDEVRARCITTLIEPDQTCKVGAFGKVGVVAGHDFFYASYDVNDPSFSQTSSSDRHFRTGGFGHVPADTHLRR